MHHVDDYPWSSHDGYVSSAKQWDWLHKECILSMLTDRKNDRLKAYRQFMAMADTEEITAMLERKKWPTFIGDETFVRWLKGEYFERKSDSQIPESVTLAPNLEVIKRVVCSYYDMGESELLKSRRGWFNEPRSMAIYLARMRRKDGLKDIGSEFGLSGYSSTSSILDGMRTQLQKDGALRTRFEEIKRGVSISQTET